MKLPVTSRGHIIYDADGKYIPAREVVELLNANLPLKRAVEAFFRLEEAYYQLDEAGVRDSILTDAESKMEEFRDKVTDAAMSLYVPKDGQA